MLKKHNSMWPLRCLSGSHFKNGRLQLLETPPFQPPRSQPSLPCSPPHRIPLPRTCPLPLQDCRATTDGLVYPQGPF